MKVTIDGREIQLDKSKVVVAKKAIGTMLDAARHNADTSGDKSLYVTTLIMMYTMSTELLNELEADGIKYILEHGGNL